MFSIMVILREAPLGLNICLDGLWHFFVRLRNFFFFLLFWGEGGGVTGWLVQILAVIFHLDHRLWAIVKKYGLARSGLLL